MKNRVEHSMRTCDVLEQLEPRPLEILITASGCTDGTKLGVQGRGSVASGIRQCVRRCWQWTPHG